MNKHNDLLKACPKPASVRHALFIYVGGGVVAIVCTIMLAISIISPA